MDLNTLVDKAKNSDAEAMGWMYDTFAPKMRLTCIRILEEDTDVVDDLVHDAFVLAYTSITTLQEADKLEAWLCAIVRNLTLRYLDVKQMRATQPLSTLQDESPCLADLSQATDSRILTAEVLSVINELPAGYRKILRLHIFEGYSHQDIAEMLGIASHSSSSQLSRAKSALRKMMAERKMWLVLIISLLIIPIYRYFTGKDQTTTGEESRGQQISRTDKKRPAKDSENIEESYQAEQIHYGPGSETIARNTSSSSDRAYTPTQITTNLPDTLIVAPQDSVSEKNMLADNTDKTDNISPLKTDTTRIVPIHDIPSYDLAESSGATKKRGWVIGGLGTLGSALSESAGAMLASTASDITSSKPQEFDNWEAYNEDLLINNPQPDEKTRALMEIAANNSGDIVEREDHKQPLTFGLSLAKPIGGRWTFDTGLQYTLLRSTFQVGSEGYSIDRKQKIHYLGIPLRMSYRFLQTKGFTGYAAGGMTVNIPLYGNANEYYVVNSEPLQTDKWKLSPAWQFSLSTSIGLQYRLTPHIGLYVEPTLNYYIPAGSSVRTIWTAHPFTVTVPFGLRVTW